MGKRICSIVDFSVEDLSATLAVVSVYFFEECRVRRNVAT